MTSNFIIELPEKISINNTHSPHYGQFLTPAKSTSLQHYQRDCVVSSITFSGRPQAPNLKPRFLLFLYPGFYLFK